MEPLIEIKNVSKSYGSKQVLKNVSLTIERNKIVGLLGRNGVGKSTLIKMLNGLLSIDKGSIKIDGKEVGIETKKIVSYLPERTYLDKSMTIKEVLTFFEEFYDDFSLTKAMNLLEDLHLDMKSRISVLSKGMQEKLQLILVMSRQADVYILDEPLGGIDPATRDYILDTILSNFKDGASVIISTHLISDIERILDEVILLDDGQVKLKGSADEIREKEGKSIDEIFREMFKC